MAFPGIAGNDGRDSIAIDGHAHAASVVIDQYRERSQLTGLMKRISVGMPGKHQTD